MKMRLGRKFALVLAFMTVTFLNFSMKWGVSDGAVCCMAWVVSAFIIGESVVDAVASLRGPTKAAVPAGTGPKPPK